MRKKLAIDIVSDVVCPWCLIGSRRLEMALERFPDLDVALRFHPFLLDPSVPPEGKDLRAHLRARYGADPESMFGRVEAAARSSGIDLDFAKVQRFPNTLRAHTLLRFAAEKAGDVQRRVARSLFDAYFQGEGDISNVDVLVGIAERHGLPADEARAFLDDEAKLEETRQEAASASRSGISGVPFVVLDEKLAVPGAQEVAVFEKAIRQVLAG
jgi:predicted DsbA family dithiol-disulfide isomerase